MPKASPFRRTWPFALVTAGATLSTSGLHVGRFSTPSNSYLPSPTCRTLLSVPVNRLGASPLGWKQPKTARRRHVEDMTLANVEVETIALDSARQIILRSNLLAVEISNGSRLSPTRPDRLCSAGL